MKKLVYYTGVMIIVIILLPLIIVKGCSRPVEEKPIEQVVVSEEYKITVYRSDISKMVEMELEEYIKGVLAAEMPADFDQEALKAQAVAARTFAYGRMSGAYKSKQGVHDEADICTDSTHCQAWVSEENAKKKWNKLFASRNWSKIEKAVRGTKGKIVIYEGKVANTLFHASSSGKTENAEDVWDGVVVPYLRSVTSSGEEESKGYITTISVKAEDFINKLQEKYVDKEFDEDVYKKIKILDYTTGGRVRTLEVGDITMKGTEFRVLLGLRSANFKIDVTDDATLKITTTGYGHGVGMSQWGADSLAKRGGTYTEILKHYYQGVDILSIKDYETNNF
jgi:stage II sporulation protein D